MFDAALHESDGRVTACAATVMNFKVLSAPRGLMFWLVDTEAPFTYSYGVRLPRRGDDPPNLAFRPCDPIRRRIRRNADGADNADRTR